MSAVASAELTLFPVEPYVVDCERLGAINSAHSEAMNRW